MKTFSFELDKRKTDWLLTSIRQKEDLILLLMNSLKLLIVEENTIKPKQPYAEITIVISKFSRIFFSLPNKLISFNFPFLIDTSDSSRLIIYNQHIGEIDSKTISQVITALSHKQCLQKECVYDFLAAIDENIENTKFWYFFKELLTFEDGYIRYDYDDSSRQNDSHHPLNHLDIFYSGSNSFKLGLNNTIDIKAMLNILDPKEPCFFIQ